MASKATRTSRRDDFLFWWPVLARVTGVIGGFSEATFALITHQSADAGVLGFCGLLVAVPIIFQTQDKRNGGGS